MDKFTLGLKALHILQYAERYNLRICMGHHRTRWAVYNCTNQTAVKAEMIESNVYSAIQE